MTILIKRAREVFAGLDASGQPRAPSLLDASEWGSAIELLSSVGASSGGALGFTTLANLNQNLQYPPSTTAWVVADGLATSNAVYTKVGAAGLGSWQFITKLPYNYVPLSVTGGTANAIELTASIRVAGALFEYLYIFTPAVTNTGAVTIKINNEPFASLKDNGGSALAAGYLVADAPTLFVFNGVEFRTLCDARFNVNPLATSAAAVSFDRAGTSVVATNLQDALEEIALDRPRWRGAWNSATNYARGDVVRRSGRLQIANTANVNKDPDTQSEWDDYLDPFVGGALTQNLTAVAGTTSAASLTIPQGVAPTSPANGDAWRTSTEFLMRIGGASLTAAWQNRLNTFSQPQLFDAALRFGTKALTLVSGANNDVDATTGCVFAITGPSAPFTINGITGAFEGQTITLINLTAQDMTIGNEAVASTDFKRIRTLTGANITLAGQSSATLHYIQSQLRWHVTATHA